MSSNICRKNKFGFCKFSEKCHFRHINEKCEVKQCSSWQCEKRHPKVCKHYRDLGYCKFTTFCKFDHKKQKHNAENGDRISKIEKKLEEIDTIKTSEQQECRDTSKIDDLENMVNQLEIKIEEKDEAIAELTNRLKEMENKFTNIYSNEVSTKLSELDRRLKMFEKSPELTVFKCNLCEFSSTSEKGLKTHKSRMHTASHNEDGASSSYPKQCDICEKTLRTKEEMKKHLKTHSYIRPVFKCEKCEFCCETELTMEVHQGKNHDTNFECGLCGFLAKTEEDLDLHLFTCEIYLCDDCSVRLKTISDLKKHLNDDKHKIINNRYYKIIHAKIGQNSDSEIKQKTYYKEDFISKNERKKSRQ